MEFRAISHQGNPWSGRKQCYVYGGLKLWVYLSLKRPRFPTPCVWSCAVHINHSLRQSYSGRGRTPILRHSGAFVAAQFCSGAATSLYPQPDTLLPALNRFFFLVAQGVQRWCSSWVVVSRRGMQREATNLKPLKDSWSWVQNLLPCQSTKSTATDDVIHV